jgi:hypothetical protein
MFFVKSIAFLAANTLAGIFTERGYLKIARRMPSDS